eukprot:CAMPEP_0170508392 /NCGR_PEP_ID=MMETSP0208-20121228/62190_1 /TAXON_ID=197538 /ORGANISM="Strombidium inclinatum, Strain S3" /LENGTH=193 /DNA_ID=CAMNT_0010791257 /DNA_START=188 /DNA_END=769 /DNA_ORIENTATION=-
MVLESLVLVANGLVPELLTLDLLLLPDDHLGHLCRLKLVFDVGLLSDLEDLVEVLLLLVAVLSHEGFIPVFLHLYYRLQILSFFPHRFQFLPSTLSLAFSFGEDRVQLFNFKLGVDLDVVDLVLVVDLELGELLFHLPLLLEEDLLGVLGSKQDLLSLLLDRVMVRLHLVLILELFILKPEQEARNIDALLAH